MSGGWLAGVCSVLLLLGLESCAAGCLRGAYCACRIGLHGQTCSHASTCGHSVNSWLDSQATATLQFVRATGIATEAATRAPCRARWLCGGDGGRGGTQHAQAKQHKLQLPPPPPLPPPLAPHAAPPSCPPLTARLFSRGLSLRAEHCTPGADRARSWGQEGAGRGGASQRGRRRGSRAAGARQGCARGRCCPPPCPAPQGALLQLLHGQCNHGVPCWVACSFGHLEPQSASLAHHVQQPQGEQQAEEVAQQGVAGCLQAAAGAAGRGQQAEAGGAARCGWLAGWLPAGSSDRGTRPPTQATSHTWQRVMQKTGGRQGVPHQSTACSHQPRRAGCAAADPGQQCSAPGPKTRQAPAQGCSQPPPMP